jgi:sRNA-binding protein
MKSRILAAASGFALSVFLSASPAGAQSNYPAPSGDRVDAAGLPTTHSTPQEQAATAGLNGQAAATVGQNQAQTAASDAQYQQQQQQYQQQQQQYQNQMRRHEAAQERYEDRTAAYENLRAHYAAERAAYHRDLWPERHWDIIARDANPIGERVELISGNRVGTVIDAAHAGDGDVEALLVRLDNDKVVWIDSQDIRYNRADGVVMTDLRFDDLHHMADERL